MARRRTVPATAADVADRVAGRDAFLMPLAEDLPFDRLLLKALEARAGKAALRARERFMAAWGGDLSDLGVYAREVQMTVFHPEAADPSRRFVFVVGAAEPLLPREVQMDGLAFEREVGSDVLGRLWAEKERRERVLRWVDQAAACAGGGVEKVVAAVSPAYRGLMDLPRATPAYQNKVYRWMPMAQAAEIERWFAEAVMLGARERGRPGRYVASDGEPRLLRVVVT
jgi:hypothetical protein